MPRGGAQLDTETVDQQSQVSTSTLLNTGCFAAYLRLALLLRFLLLLSLLLRLVLRTLRGFLAAIGLTVHAVPPFVSLGGQQEGSPPTCDEVSGLSQSSNLC